MTARLGPPVVAYAGMGVCDSKYQHEIVFLTDGFVAYAYGEQCNALVSRDGSRFTVRCGEVVGSEWRMDDHRCDGEFTFDLSDEATPGRGWGSDPEQLALLVCCGEPVDE
jgi:hypothetical protein